MPATTDFWINDAKCEPLFFVTAQANDSLLSILGERSIKINRNFWLREVRRLCDNGHQTSAGRYNTGQGSENYKCQFHTMSTPRANRALKQLCDIMNQESSVYPGTNMTVVFTTE